MRITGTMKWFSDGKGLGFVMRDDGEQDEFDVVPGTKGPAAENLARIGD